MNQKSTEILDEIQEDQVDNRQQLINIGLVAIVAVSLLLLFEYGSEIQLFAHLMVKFEKDDLYLDIVFVSLFFFIISIIVPTFLNKIRPEISILFVGIFTGLITLLVLLVYVLLEHTLIHQQKNYTIAAYIFSFLYSFLIANFRIHRLRGKGILIPILICIGCWIIGNILKQVL